MAQFKVKYATRNKLARSLQKEIRDLELIDSWSLHDSIRISAVSSAELNKLEITINALYYYFFLDEGTVNIGAFNITDKWLSKSETQAIISEIVKQFMEWQLAEYPLLDMAKILNNPKVLIYFNWIDDSYGLPTAPHTRFS